MLTGLAGVFAEGGQSRALPQDIGLLHGKENRIGVTPSLRRCLAKQDGVQVPQLSGDALPPFRSDLGKFKAAGSSL